MSLCKWYSDFEGVCCNGDCKEFCTDNCPFDGYPEDCKYGEEKKPTNFDRIKAMSVEEMAGILNKDRCYLVGGNNKDCDGDCGSCIFEWLESEVQG